MTFKIAYCAGHYIGTAGKRVPKSLDKNQTREWTLNDRIARYFADASKQYEGVELLRTDDVTGKKHISIKNRTKKANEWGADIYLDMHHNAAGKVFSGGGVVAFSKKKDATGKEYRDAIYAAVISAGKLKGNRATPLVEKNYETMVCSKASAVLIEYGFMDSKVDAPIILTDAYAKKVAYATMEAIAKVKGLNKKTEKPAEPKEPEKTVEKPKTETQKATDGAKSFLETLAGTYKVTASSLNVRNGAGTTKKKMVAIPKGTKVKCYGYYTSVSGTKWLYIQFTYNKVKYTGFASAKYLQKG